MAGRGRPGRGWGTLRGSSQEINDLACLLRELIDGRGIGLRALRGLLTPDHFPTGVVPPLSTLSERLSGKGLDWPLVEAVIDICVAGPATRRRTDEAKRLWRQHRRAPTPAHPDPTPALPAAPPAAGGPLVAAQQHTIEAQARLVHALEARAASEQALTNSTQLIGALLVMIGRLEAQVAALERAAGPGERIRHRLAAARSQLGRAGREMAGATTDQREALALVRATDERVADLTAALRALDWEAPVPQDGTVDVWAVTGLVARASDPTDGALLEDVSAALRRVHTAIDACVSLIHGTPSTAQGADTETDTAGAPTGERTTREPPAPPTTWSPARPPRPTTTPTPKHPKAIHAQHVWQSDEWQKPFPELLRALDTLYRSGSAAQLADLLREVSLLPPGDLAEALAALRGAGHETALRRVLKGVAERPTATVFEAVLALRGRSLPQDAERLMWDFTSRQRGPLAPIGAITAPGQRARSAFVTHYGPVPAFRPERWKFRVFGATAFGAAHDLTLEQLHGLPTAQLTADLHCVTKRTWPDNNWGGVLVSTVLDLVPPAADVTHMMVWAEYGYSANLRLSDVTDGRAILATHHHGEPLSLEHGFPLRLVTPHLYGYKGPKWVRGIEYMVGDRRGFWEERGYHNRGEVRHEQRYSYQEAPDEGPPL